MKQAMEVNRYKKKMVDGTENKRKAVKNLKKDVVRRI
jgi:hypothetical protein